MSTSYDITRLPVDTAKGIVNLASWPFHFGKTMVTNTTDTAFKVIGANTEDAPSKQSLKGDSIYEMATDNLDIAGVIYYYTELRSETRRRVKEFCISKKMSWDVINPKKPSNLILLSNAMKHVEKQLNVIKSPETTASVAAMKNYQESVSQLEGLRTRFKLDIGDVEILETYLKILEEPKSLTDIKSDAILFDKYINPGFAYAFGGTVYNRRKIESMISADKGMYIHQIDDDFNATTIDPQGAIKGFSAEVVWAIVVCEKEKKITVVFRGSVNAKDWMSNVQCNMCDFQLPGFTEKDADNSKSYGRVHEGFYKYLFHETKSGANGSTKSKGEEIVGMLKGDFFDKPEYNDYSLYVTGHSLGGALSTMFAFRAAVFGEFKKPVTNVSFASPFVGNQEFRDDFIDAERKRKIRHLRISNYQDVVTLIPSTTLPLPHGMKRYKHVGMNIRLYKGGDLFAPNYRRFYPKVGSFTDGLRNTLHANIFLGLSMTPIGNHLCPEYTARLNDRETAKELSKLSLDELYANKDITGWDYL